MISHPPHQRSRWSSREAWICSAVLIAYSFGISGLLRLGVQAKPRLDYWLGNPYVIAAFSIFQSTIWLLLIFGLVRAKSLRDFVRTIGLSKKPSLLGWGAAWVAILMGTLAYQSTRVAAIPRNPLTAPFFGRGEIVRLCFIILAVVIGPICEELLMRGFLYRAFRKDYGRLMSTSLVVGMDGFFHWQLISRNLYALVFILSIGILLCIIRERTESLWNCVLFHAMFNGSQSLNLAVYIVGMILLFPLVGKGTGSGLKKVSNG